MPRVDLDLHVDVARSPRVVQLEGIFDVPRTERATVEFHFDVPLEEKPWQVGLIVGPSGAGKSSVARYLFGDAIVESYEWSRDKAIVDCFGDLGIREVTTALSSVGFSTPPAWIKPYHVLSTGEKFRANMARAITDPRELVVIDEFTSVVDRTVARIGSFAIAKSIRKAPGKKFVAVSCHDDIVEWLQPDWVLEPHVGRFTWRSPSRRPDVEFEVVRAGYEAWSWFAPHHYLSATLHRSAKCFVGYVEGRPAAFAGVMHLPHPRRRNLKSVSRFVVLPDFQGLGIGGGPFVDLLAASARAAGYTLCCHPAHPALIKAHARSPKWKMTAKPAFQAKVSEKSTVRHIMKDHAKYRRVAHFQYVGEPFPDVEAAKRLWA